MTEATTAEASEKVIPRIEGAPEGLQLSTLDGLVDYESKLQEQFLAQHEIENYDEFLDGEVVKLLQSHGIEDDEDDPKTHGTFVLAKHLYKQIITTDKDKWLVVPENDTVQPRNAALNTVRDYYEPIDSDSDEDESRASSVTGDTFHASAAKAHEQQDGRDKASRQDGLIEDLYETRKTYAALIAERSKRAIESKGRTGTIDDRREWLIDIIGAVATEMMDELEADGLTEKQIATEIDKFVGEQMDEVVAEIEAERAASYENARPLTKKFLDKWASWGKGEGSIFTKERLKGNLYKAGIFAVPGLAIGAAAAPLVGAVGGSIAAGAAVGLAGRSIFRSLAGARLDNAANANTLATEQADAMRGDIVANQEASHIELLNMFDARSEVYRKRNRNRLVGGTAIAMTAGMLGGALVNEIAHSGLFGKAGDVIANGFGDDSDKDKLLNFHDRDGDGIPNRFDTDRDGDGVLNGNDPAPNNPNIPETTITDTPRNELFDGRLGTRELTPEGREALAEQLNGYKVKSGDSVWSLSEQFLHEQGVENPTTYEIDATKDTLLKELQASGNADSRGWLSAGDTIKIK